MKRASNGHWEQWRLRWYWWAATGLEVGFVLPGRHRRLHVPRISQHDTVGGV